MPFTSIRDSVTCRLTIYYRNSDRVILLTDAVRAFGSTLLSAPFTAEFSSDAGHFIASYFPPSEAKLKAAASTNLSAAFPL